MEKDEPFENYFRNDDYVTPPGSLTELLAHPFFSETDTVELSIFNDHRYAFFFWNKWTLKRKRGKQKTKPPCLVTLDWHQDLLWPNNTEKKWLDSLDTDSNKDVAYFAWANLNPLNDGHIMAATYLNLIGDVYVHCRQGTLESSWANKLFKDKYGNTHTVRKFKSFEALEECMLASKESKVYFDIDLDFFTLNNPYNGVGKTFTYLTEVEIRNMLAKERPLIEWIFQRLQGFTIAIEPEHSGGFLKASRLLNLISKIYFKPALFSNYGDNWAKRTNWSHLTRF